MFVVVLAQLPRHDDIAGDTRARMLLESYLYALRTTKAALQKAGHDISLADRALSFELDTTRNRLLRFRVISGRSK